jgi:hypothetical protein
MIVSIFDGWNIQDMTQTDYCGLPISMWSLFSEMPSFGLTQYIYVGF